MNKVISKYNALKKKYPDIAEDLVMRFFDTMEDIALDTLTEYECEQEYGCHIGTEEMYEEAVNLFEWVNNKGTGARWSVEDIEKSANINFAAKNYTLYDYCYVVNMLYSDFCNVFTDSGFYLKMAENYLEDPDYMGEASERAYCNAKKRIKYNNEN